MYKHKLSCATSHLGNFNNYVYVVTNNGNAYTSIADITNDQIFAIYLSNSNQILGSIGGFPGSEAFIIAQPSPANQPTSMNFSLVYQSNDDPFDVEITPL